MLFMVDYLLRYHERRRFTSFTRISYRTITIYGDETVSNENCKIKLNFNHPVKELVWVVYLRKMN